MAPISIAIDAYNCAEEEAEKSAQGLMDTFRRENHHTDV